ncbi:hypothetical protein GCM10009422_02960 [Brevundimonas kwangchunensis]|uniref:Uncharacterized protein n=1 Tax=Brevundimonas kwangchunensis TaxID=322163 RepID=A0ABN1GH85_9CAUL
MTRIVLAFAVLAFAGPALAQTPPPVPPAGLSTFDRHQIQADQHRQRMDQLRNQSDQRQALTNQLRLEGDIARQRVEQSRQPDPYTSNPPAIRSPEEERAARAAATEHQRRTARDVGQIDSWLDRGPN